MGFEKFLFYAFALILVFSAVRVITVRNPVHAALFLVLAFFTSAALWLLIEAEFLAIVLVLVYVGAVMVLFLFVIMMLDINIVPLKRRFYSLSASWSDDGADHCYRNGIGSGFQLFRRGTVPAHSTGS
jgi:NADH:ubiquinone oxidoreductase subunit 6 (subunit J)